MIDSFKAFYPLGKSEKPNKTFPLMSEIDIRALEDNFKNWKQERAPDEPEWKAFEIYAAEHVLKDSDMTTWMQLLKYWRSARIQFQSKLWRYV